MDALKDLRLQYYLKQASTPKAQTNPRFIVGSIRPNGTIRFSEDPAIHTSEESARKEVERLARLHVGTTFVYFELKGTAKAKDVDWS
jgi:hypothetical protein